MIVTEDGLVEENIDERINDIMNEFEDDWLLDIYEERKYEDPSSHPAELMDYDDDNDNYDDYDIGLDEEDNIGEEKRA
jgi:hypothetical protein